MATPYHAQAVKSLNKSPGRRRFVFKTFSQRIEDIDINVFRSLNKIKSEASEGSSFLRDCLVEWRELNTAEDFISFYAEAMPFVQTLPLVLLHKELIFTKLILRLQMKARLSLEPILRLLAAFSRDLLEDFLPFLPRMADALVSLLKSGADREPEIIEQIFTSWSCIMMHLQKYLIRDIINVLKVTVRLRYYPKDYVQEFMAEATSFLLRNAPVEQLIKGIRKTMFEVVKNPLPIRKSGVSALLCYVMLGTSSRFHSGAERVLRLLVDNSIFAIGDKFPEGSDAILEVVISAFQKLSEELEPKELTLMWECLYQEINDSETNGSFLHLSRLLSLLTSAVQVNYGRGVSNYQQMLKVVGSLVQKIVLPSSKGIGCLQEVVDKVLSLMLHILDGLYGSNNLSSISGCLLQWTPVFELGNSSLVTFLRELLLKDPSVIYIFRDHILSAMNDLVESSSEEVICLLLSFFERLQMHPQSSNFLDGISEGRLSKICHYMQGVISNWIRLINDIVLGNSLPAEIDDTKLAVLWGVISCYPHMFDVQANGSVLMDLIDALHQLLMTEDEYIAGVSKHTWESLVGSALGSHNKWYSAKKPGHGEMCKVLHLAKGCKSSSQVLLPAADYLDNVNGPALQADSSKKIYHPVLKGENTVDAVGIFADNLCHPDKGIRLPTLRILCHYEPLGCEISDKDQPAEKKLKTEGSQACIVDTDDSNVLQLLLSIEVTPLSISTSRKVTLLISRIQMGLSPGRISETYGSLVLNGIIGIFHNRFSYIWDAASECLSVLISKHTGLVWDRFISYFEQCQSLVQASDLLLERVNANLFNSSSDLVTKFNLFLKPASDNTPVTSVLSLLLQSLQKIPSVAESQSRQIIPLFLRFLGYDSDNLVSVGSFNSDIYDRKEWKGILKEWLSLLKLMRNPRSFYRNQFVKDVLQNRLLDETDAEIQARVLDCLLLWKDDFLLPYGQHLKNLINSKYLREELTTWSLSKESGLIEEGHRVTLVPLVVRLLIPKIRKLKTLASRKHASVHLRKAVLGFIAQLDAHELPLFFALLLKPLQIISNEDDCASNLYWNLPNSSIDEFHAPNYLKYFTVENITALSWKKRYGFLHVIEDVIGVFDEFHVRPFLDLLMGCVVRVLASCSSSIDIARVAESSLVKDHPGVELISDDKDSAVVNDLQTGIAIKQFKDLRSLCLKVVSLVLNKYEDHDFGCEFWDLFFTSMKPLIHGFKQEGSSSEKPSSLFSCFLAMSRSHRLVSLLCRERNLVPDIFSILTVPTASEAILSCVLKFISNLLDLDCELDDENSPIQSVIYPNLEALVCSLHHIFQSDSASKRKLVRCPGETEIRIFKLLSKYIRDPLLAKKFVDILLPFLSNRVQGSGICLDAIQVIRDIIPVLGSERTTEIINAVAPLLISVKLDIRVFICDLLEALARTDASVLVVARHVRQLNATSAFELDELDYDTIGKGYEEIGIGFFRAVPVEHTLLILSQCVYDMSSEELILRHHAYRLFLTFLEFSAKILGQEVTDHHETAEEMMIDDEGCWTRACVQRIINKFLLKNMGDAISWGISVRKEWIDLLREMVVKLPQLANLNLFRALCSEDADQDFFNNIIHLQKHKRAKALSRFADVISKSNMSKDIINKVFIPLFFNMLFDLQHGKDEHVRTACMQALASVSAKMEWKSYHTLLLRCFREIRMKPDKQKVLLRLICCILDQFSYAQICSNQGSKDSLDKILGSETSSTISSSLQNGGNSVMVAEIQTCLQNTVLPKIQNLLSSDSGNVNVNISLAALKLLKLLPGDTMESQLSSIIYRISNFLKNRLESTRDEARSALAECLKELGLEYLQFIVRVLRATLKRGFELHVLGYTLNFVLSKTLSKSTYGSLDYCLEDLLCVVENDILGDVAEEKEVEKIASKMKETRKCKSFETLKLIAQSITFKIHAVKLLSPVTAHLQKHLTPKVKAKLENMLKHIADGIECNPTVNQTDLFIFVYGLIADATNEENGLGVNSSGTEANKHGNEKTVFSGQAFGTKSACSHLITVFALGVLQNRIKSIKLDKNDQQLLSMLDPFIKLLGNCLSSKYEDVLSASLRCLTPLVRLPLPSLESQSDKLKVTLLNIAQGSVNPGNPLMQSCLKLLTVLLRSTKITLSSDQLHLLVQFPMFVDLERNPSFVALSLLKAIVKRKLVVHEIYDIVVQVAELMVTSQVEPIRKKCSQILLQFLLDYHLSEKRLQQHLDFLLANLRYEHPTGRESVLEMLHAIMIKFPKSIVDEQSQTIFVHLVVCLANDQDNKVRSMTGAIIKLLIGRVSQHSVNSFLEYSLSWYMGEKQQLWSAGAQVLGLVIEVMKKGFQKHISRILPVTKRILHSTIDALTNTEMDLSDESTIPFWKEAYYSLVMLEKMLLQFHDLSFERDLEDIWETICELLLHPHAWLRNVSNRLIALYFTNMNEARRGSFEKSYGALFLMMPSRLFMIAVSLCCQLKAPISDDEAATKDVRLGAKKEKEKIHHHQSSLITKNLVFTIGGLNSLMKEWAGVNHTKFWFTLEQHEQELFLKGFQLLNPRKATGMFLSITGATHDQNDTDHSEGLQYLLVFNLLKELGKLALQMEAIQMRIVFNSFRKILPEIGKDDCRHYASYMMLPLYKVCEGFAGKIIHDDLKQLAQEVLESIQKTLGTEDFGHVYGEIKKKLKSKRDKRKREEKRMAVINPERNAKRKLRIAAKHRANKKRKIMVMKMERWMR
ncbi:small subunit processome component 20 homolog isoform X1 [Herrania umbratica]|uniref:Small subunit processome component 20 homolog isoform X1 n=1 Tax=Herrania umbratica TaxID=108875 RepID=A0A6J1AUT9_9ROSI|nr:small subunit processome component 20 homolog isoform X1 [Herrania umbratica]